jgi:putative tryptophan/tyrosine transport system substrate-binding protein
MAISIGRRQFISVLGGAAVCPLTARAQQQPDRMRRIGVLVNLPESDPQMQARLGVFRQTLAKLDWLEDRNVRIDYRFSVNTIEQGEAGARELMELQPEVILAHGTPAVAALRNVTRIVPIVFVVVSEPVAQGFVQNLSRPGGNITGFSYLEPSLGAKWLELLKEIAPHVQHVAIMFNPDTAPNAALFLHSVQAAAPTFAVESIESLVRDLAEIEETMVRVAHAPGGGLIVLPDVFTGLHRKAIFERAAYYRLPAIYSFPNYAVEGGLISYGVDIEDLYGRAAAYVDRILRGVKPTDLPVQQPTKFELVINLKTARALGLTVPPSLLAIADDVIE